MPTNLVALVQDTFSHIKDSHRIVEELDPHAPVELHFGNTPTIRITQLADDVVQLLAKLSDQLGLPASTNAMAVIDIAAAPAPWAEHDCLSLTERDGHLYLHAIINAPYLDDGNVFAVSLAGFYDRLFDICQAIRG